MNGLREQIERARSGELPAEALAQLRRRLLEDPVARREWMEDERFDRELEQLVRARSERHELGFYSARLQAEIRRVVARRRSGYGWQHVAALAALLLVGVGLISLALHAVDRSDPDLPRVVAAAEASTALPGPGRPFEVGADERRRLVYPDGTEVTVTGPARLAVDAVGGKRLRLMRGGLECEVAPQAADRPLRVIAPDATVTVVGTRFRVAVGAAGGSTVAVDHGLVAVEELASGRRSRLAAGQRLHVGERLPEAGRGGDVVAAPIDLRSPVRRLGLTMPPLDQDHPEAIFLDLVRQSGPWASLRRQGDGWRPGGRLDLRADGWVARLEPDQAALMPVAPGLVPALPAGIYRCTWSGRGLLEVVGAARVVASAPGGMDIELSAGSAGWALRLVATDPADPLRALEILPPGSGPADSQTFHPRFIERCSGAGILDLAWWGDQRQGPVATDWSLRAQRDLAPGHPERGVPYEDQIALANHLDADLWLSVPAHATPGYCRALAELLARELEPGRRVVVELGIELWLPVSSSGADARARGIERGHHPGQAHLFYAAEQIRLLAPVFDAVLGERVQFVWTSNIAERSFLDAVMTGLGEDRHLVDIVSLDGHFGGHLGADPDAVLRLLEQDDAVLAAAVAADAGRPRVDPVVEACREWGYEPWIHRLGPHPYPRDPGRWDRRVRDRFARLATHPQVAPALVDLARSRLAPDPDQRILLWLGIEAAAAIDPSRPTRDQVPTQQAFIRLHADLGP